MPIAHQVVHAAQKLGLRREMLPSGRAVATLRIPGLWGKRVGALLSAVCGADTARFRSVEARFARPAYPGDTLLTEIWLEGESASFETRNQHGESLIERCVFEFAKSQG